jgi:hypothetical protein
MRPGNFGGRTETKELTMTWKSFHNRGEILRTVIDTANERCDGMLPVDVDGVAEKFRDELDLLASLQLKWHTRLAGQIEKEFWLQPLDLEEAIASAWGKTADEMPGVRLLLDRYRSEPTTPEMARAMSRATEKEHMMLATSAGRSSVGDEIAIPIGAGIETHARTTHHGRTRLAAVAADEDAKPTFLERLRAAVA